MLSCGMGCWGLVERMEGWCCRGPKCVVDFGKTLGPRATRNGASSAPVEHSNFVLSSVWIFSNLELHRTCRQRRARLPFPAQHRSNTYNGIHTQVRSSIIYSCSIPHGYATAAAHGGRALPSRAAPGCSVASMFAPAGQHLRTLLNEQHQRLTLHQRRTRRRTWWIWRRRPWRARRLHSPWWTRRLWW